MANFTKRNDGIILAKIDDGKANKLDFTNCGKNLLISEKGFVVKHSGLTNCKIVKS